MRFVRGLSMLTVFSLHALPIFYLFFFTTLFFLRYQPGYKYLHFTLCHTYCTLALVVSYNEQFHRGKSFRTSIEVLVSTHRAKGQFVRLIGSSTMVPVYRSSHCGGYVVAKLAKSSSA